MAWNEPGNNDNKDSWGNGDKKPSNKNPKDLDDSLKQLQKKFTAFISKKNGNDSGTGQGNFLGLGIIIAVVAVILWGATGFFVVQPPEKAVVLHFGKYEKTVGPGLHWIPRVIQSEQKVNVQQLQTYTYPANGNAQMLTKDQNIVAVAITVQFRIDHPKNFLFNVVSPVESLRQATASALRQVIGKMDLSDILTTGRETVRNDVKAQLDKTINRYQSGIQVVNVLLKTAQAPDAVKAAFDDAVKAQEDEKRYVNQAQAYTMKVEPIANGQAKRILETAKAYQQQVVLKAQAKVSPFLALLPEYNKAPNVTRERLYLEGIESVLHRSSKVFVDSTGSHNILYLPLNKLLNSAGATTDTVATASLVKIPSLANGSDANKQTTNNLDGRPTRDQAYSGYVTKGDNNE